MKDRPRVDERARRQVELDRCVEVFGPPGRPRVVTPYTLHAEAVAAEDARLASAADRVLAALQEGPKTNLDLIHICQRISGRIYDLRQRGYTIDTDPLEPGVYRYTLHQEADHAQEV